MTLCLETLPSMKRADFMDDTVFGTIRGLITIVTRFSFTLKNY